jgi:hypothetical protein
VQTADEEGGPPEPTELMALPEETEESIPVICNGRRGTFITRTQCVEYGGNIVTATKFEQICGRADAKKWKTSLWLMDEFGTQTCTLQVTPVSPPHNSYRFRCRSVASLQRCVLCTEESSWEYRRKYELIYPALTFGFRCRST